MVGKEGPYICCSRCRIRTEDTTQCGVCFADTFAISAVFLGILSSRKTASVKAFLDARGVSHLLGDPRVPFRDLMRVV